MRKRFMALFMSVAIGVLSIGLAGFNVNTAYANSLFSADKSSTTIVYPNPQIKANVPGERPTPQEDMFIYANYDFLKNKELKPGYSNYTALSEVAEQTQADTKKLLTKEYAEASDSQYVKMVYEMYSRYMDMDARNKSGWTTIIPYIEKIEQAKTVEDIFALAEENKLIRDRVLSVNLQVTIDSKNTPNMIASMQAPSLNLDDSAEYKKRTELGDIYYNAYHTLYNKLLLKYGYSEAEAAKMIENEYKWEEKLSEYIYPTEVSYRADYRELIYNCFTKDELIALMNGYPIERVLKMYNKADIEKVLIDQPEYFKALGTLYTDENIEMIKAEGNIDAIESVGVTKGERGAAYIAQKFDLETSETWCQVFDTFLTAAKIATLRNDISDREKAQKLLADDIAATEKLMTTYIAEADGVQQTAEEMTCAHHRANVMFNIMRGGFFADNGKINTPDLIEFVRNRNREKGDKLEKVLSAYKGKNSVEKADLEKAVDESGDLQLKRLFMEYMPVIFSRRHGDPSRPWNKFNIKLNDYQGNPILNYEGNWRDIFQNWEALAMSYPAYIKNIAAKFVNAMTIDGFNPYRISRDGIDWECPEPDNPWAQYGYWGDHQVIYLQKLLEQWNAIDHDNLLASLDEKLYTSSNVPYRIKSYKDLCKNPRDSVAFDKELSDKLIADSAKFGTDRKLFTDSEGQPELVSLTAKLLQIIIAKMAN